MSHHFEYSGGYQSWDGVVSKDKHDELDCDRDPHTHLHCDGPTKGTKVKFERKDKNGNILTGTGVVSIHWHYEGCMIDLGEGSPSLCPSLGDRVEVIDA